MKLNLIDSIYFFFYNFMKTFFNIKKNLRTFGLKKLNIKVFFFFFK